MIAKKIIFTSIFILFICGFLISICSLAIGPINFIGDKNLLFVGISFVSLLLIIGLIIKPDETIFSIPIIKEHPNFSLTLIIPVFLLIIAVIIASFTGNNDLRTKYFNLIVLSQILLLSSSCIILFFKERKEKLLSLKFDKKLIFSLLLIIIIGLFLRILPILGNSINSSYLTKVLTLDEIQSGKRGFAVLTDSNFRPIDDPHENSYYGTALFFKIFGTSLLSLRFYSIFFAVITIPSFYFLLRNFFSKNWSIFGTLIFSFSYWHIIYSNIAINHVHAVFFLILFWNFTWKALIKKKNFYWLLAGITLGMGLYQYWSFRLVPIIFFVFILLIISLFYKKFKLTFKENIISIIIFICAFLAIFFPSIYDMLSNPSYFERNTSIQLPIFKNDTMHIITSNATNFIKYFIFGGVDEYTLGNTILFDLFTFVLMIIGLGITLKKLNTPLGIFLFLNFISIFILGGLLVINPKSHRIFIILPFALMFSFITLKTIFDKQFFTYRKRLRFVCLSLILTGMIIFNIWQIPKFYDHIETELLYTWNAEGMSMLEEIKKRQNSSAYMYINFFPWHDGLWLLGDNYKGKIFVNSNIPDKLTEGQNVFVVSLTSLKNGKDIINKIKSNFPNGKLIEISQNYRKIHYKYVIYELNIHK